MNVKNILYDIIEKEVEKIEGNGIKVVSKTRRKKVIKNTIIFLLLFFVFFAFGLAEPGFYIVDLFLMVLYFVLLYRGTYADVIIKLAKKDPDKEIREIIEEDMK